MVFPHHAPVASFATFLMLIYLVTVGKQNLPNQSLVAKPKEREKNEIMNLYIDSAVPLFPSLLFLVFGIRPCLVTHFCSSLIQSPLNFNFPCTVYLSQIADCFNVWTMVSSILRWTSFACLSSNSECDPAETGRNRGLPSNYKHT